MKQRENEKKMSHHWPQCAEWFLKYSPLSENQSFPLTLRPLDLFLRTSASAQIFCYHGGDIGKLLLNWIYSDNVSFNRKMLELKLTNHKGYYGISSYCFSRIELWNTQQKAVLDYILFLLRSCITNDWAAFLWRKLVAWKQIMGTECTQNAILTDMPEQ